MSAQVVLMTGRRRQTGGMARRGTSGRGRRRTADPDRSLSLGAHFRADGGPKVTYRTQRDALSVADERSQDTGVSLNVYRCEYCSGWHMGNAGGRER